MYYKNKDWKQSAYYYELLFKHHPTKTKQYFTYYIQALLNNKQIKKAINVLEKHLKTNPKDNQAKTLLLEIKKQLNAAK